MVSRRGLKVAYSQLGLNPMLLEKSIFGLFSAILSHVPNFFAHGTSYSDSVGKVDLDLFSAKENRP